MENGLLSEILGWLSQTLLLEGVPNSELPNYSLIRGGLGGREFPWDVGIAMEVFSPPQSQFTMHLDHWISYFSLRSMRVKASPFQSI